MPIFAAGAPSLTDNCLDETKAKLTREAFGDLRVYYDGPTEQLKSMTAGSLRLKPGMEPHPPHQHPEEEFMVGKMNYAKGVRAADLASKPLYT